MQVMRRDELMKPLAICLVVGVLALLAVSSAQAEPNDSMALAQGPMTADFSETISTQNDVDWYFLYASAYTQLDLGLSTSGPSEACWSIVRLMNGDGGFLAEGTAFRNETSHTRYTLPATGRYYLEVTGGNCSGLGSYSISLVATPALLTSLPYIPPPSPPTPSSTAPDRSAIRAKAECERARTRVAQLLKNIRHENARPNYQSVLRGKVRRARAQVRRKC